MDLVLIGGALLALLVFGGIAFIDDIVDRFYPLDEELKYE